MAVNYKTSATDAQNMALQWYQLAGVQNPTQKALSWWTKQIQQDGSNTAYKNFQTGSGQDSADAFNPQTLAANAQAFQQKNGYSVVQPNAQTPQLAGTNTKNLGAVMDANKSWLQPLIEGATGLIPGVGPALAAAEGGLWNYSDTHNLVNGALGAVSGYGLGSLGSKLGSAAGNLFSSAAPSVGGKVATGAAVNAAAGALGGGSPAAAAASTATGGGGMEPWYDPNDDTNDPNDPTSWTGGLTSDPPPGETVPGASGGAAPAAGGATPGAGGTTSGGQGTTPNPSSWIQKLLGGGSSSNGGTSNLGSLLSGLAGGANAYTNYQGQQQRNAISEAQLAQQEAEYNRTAADTEGMDAAGLQKSLNNAPLRDKAQYMLMARLGAPATPFQPRDITHGSTSVLNGAASGGIAPVMNTMNTAAQNYTPGAGGVNTTTDQTLLNRFLNPQATTTTIPGGYTLPSGPQYTGSYASTAPSTSATSAPATPTPMSPAAPAQPAVGGQSPAPVLPVSGGTSAGGSSGMTPEEQLQQLMTQRLGGSAASQLPGYNYNPSMQVA